MPSRGMRLSKPYGASWAPESGSEHGVGLIPIHTYTLGGDVDVVRTTAVLAQQ